MKNGGENDVYVAVRKGKLKALERVERTARHARILQTGSGWVGALDAIWAALEDPALKEETQNRK
jgi:hypothetical protein